MSGTHVHFIEEPPIIGVSQEMRDVVKLAETVAPSDCCVLIEGESGTGKELIARRVYSRSRRRNEPFIPVNCAGISETLFESQFFGHVRGAFTGAEQNMLGLIRTAHGGTLFLDEVSEIPLGQQPKLLRVLQEQEVMPVGKPIPIKVDTRFLAGTNRNLQDLVRQGQFRQDLFYRLNIVRIVVPPLRVRVEDISVLLDHYSTRYAQEYERAEIELSREVRSALMEYPWPGNVRELATWVERLYVTGISPETLVEMLLGEMISIPKESRDESLTLKQAERRAILQAMQRSEFNQRKAARVLQVHRATLSRKLKRHNLT
jgi:transcriptional regulator with PAS, ATPase and Fis domain